MTIEIDTIVLLCAAAFAAGLIDAVVGGGGLLQTPMGLILLPDFRVSTVIGTLKIPAISGTAFAAVQYVKRVRMQWPLLGIMVLVSAVSSFAGSSLLFYVSNSFMKPLLLLILTILLIYTYSNKNFGLQVKKDIAPKTQIYLATVISLFIGFYDGFIGPGTGSFLVLAFIALMGFDFLHASAHAKLVNLATNLGSIVLFLIKGEILWEVALPMAASNAAGGWLGARLAIDRGNKFIRIFFLVIVLGTLLRLAFDVFSKSL